MLILEGVYVRVCQIFATPGCAEIDLLTIEIRFGIGQAP